MLLPLGGDDTKIKREVDNATLQLQELTRGGLRVLTFISVPCPASELLLACKLRGNAIK